MRKSHVIILISLLFALCLPACNQAPQPRELVSAAGRFSVMAPMTLDGKGATAGDPGRPDRPPYFLGPLGDTGYFVSYWDYPPGLVQPDKLEKMLDASRDGSVANVGGKLVREEKITLMGNPGRDLVIDTGSSAGPGARLLRGRLFIVGNRMYQIMVVTPKNQKSSPETEAFLQSFKLLGGPPPVSPSSPPAEKRD